DFALLIAAGVKAAGGEPGRIVDWPLLRGVGAKLEERARAVGKELPRKDKKALPAAVAQLDAAADPAAWLVATRATVRRAALLVAGDLATALGAAGAPALEDDLYAWGVSEAHLGLRKDLGL